MRAHEDPGAFASAWPFTPTPDLEDTLYCLHCERAMSARELRLVWDDDGAGGPPQWWVECAYEDCDGSALDLGDEPWGDLREDA